MKKQSIILTALFLVASCASSIKADKFSFKDVDENKEGIFFGEMKVVYDGEDVSDKCFLQFVDAKKNTKTLNIVKGEFKGIAPFGQVVLNSIHCQDIGMGKTQYHFTQDKKIFFDLKKSAKQTYVGRVETRWKSGSVNPGLLVAGALLGWVAIAKSADEVQLKNHDEDSRVPARAKDAFLSLMKIPYGLGWEQK